MQTRRGAEQGALWLIAALVTCVLAVPLDAQRIDDVVIGASRGDSRASPRYAAEGSAPHASMRHSGAIAVGVISDSLVAFGFDPPRPPARKCDGVGQIVTALVLGSLVTGFFISTLGLGGKTRDAVIPVVILSVAVIGVAAAVCNR